MEAALRKIGNSTGIVIPRALLGEIGLAAGGKLDLRVEDGKLVGVPKRNPREGWAEAAAAIAAAEEDPDEAAWAAFGNEGDDELTW